MQPAVVGPDRLLSTLWPCCNTLQVVLPTHAISALSMYDFIVAEKLDVCL